MRVCFFGTYDRHRPRNAVLLEGLRRRGVEVRECWWSPWHDVQDKSQIKGLWATLAVVFRFLLAYPLLAARYLFFVGPHDVVVVGYLGQLDMLLAKPLTAARRRPVVFLPHATLYETAVEDRRLAERASLVARFLKFLDVLSLALSDCVVVDTQAAGEHYRRSTGLDASRAVVVPVGADDRLFTPGPVRPPGRLLRVLFYGQFIPLQGVGTILEAARELREEPVAFRLVGRGQQYGEARAWAERQSLRNVEWISWVEYEKLPQEIAWADVCLGIFGATAKAARVIPNKVFQALAMGKPVVTGRYPVITHYLRDGEDCLVVPAGDGVALARALVRLAGDRELRERLGRGACEAYRVHFSSDVVSGAFLSGVRDTLGISR
jgi:glycosyltransferase involved in cell wall biosynthesis